MLAITSTPSAQFYIAHCKRCHRKIPTGKASFPINPIALRCVLCGEHRRYRISEIFLGIPDSLVPRHDLVPAQLRRVG